MKRYLSTNYNIVLTAYLNDNIPSDILVEALRQNNVNKIYHMEKYVDRAQIIKKYYSSKNINKYVHKYLFYNNKETLFKNVNIDFLIQLSNLHDFGVDDCRKYESEQKKLRMKNILTHGYDSYDGSYDNTSNKNHHSDHHGNHHSDHHGNHHGNHHSDYYNGHNYSHHDTSSHSHHDTSSHDTDFGSHSSHHD